MLVNSVIGTSTYVYNTSYDASGRSELRQMGSSGTIKNDYSYFGWEIENGQGRLSQIQSGVTGNLTSLQDLRYTYDANGNVLTIQDYKAGSPQTQTFSYDWLDRLTSAEANGGTGGTYTLQNYGYSSATGNLSSKAGVNYTYGDSSHEHAVTNTDDGNNYGYDANGNQITRSVGGSSYTLS